MVTKLLSHIENIYGKIYSLATLKAFYCVHPFALSLSCIAFYSNCCQYPERKTATSLNQEYLLPNSVCEGLLTEIGHKSYM